MALCRKCKAHIIFARTENGKTAPFDAKPQTFFTIFNNGYGNEARSVKVYTSHFATCPEADHFRKKGGKQNVRQEIHQKGAKD